MVMKLTISNRAAYTILAVFLILGISGIAYASLQTPPNPGHAVSEIQTCSEGESLVMSGGSWTCSPSSSRLCISHFAAPSTAGVIDLRVNGKNICEDDNGCEIQAARYSGSSFDIVSVLQTNGVRLKGRSEPFHTWASGNGVSGMNGDSTKSSIVDWAGGLRIFDDCTSSCPLGTIDTDPNKVVWYSFGTSDSILFSICD